MTEWATVTINWDSAGEKITVDPTYKEWVDSNQPNAVQWIVASQPVGAVGMEIVWKNRAPFTGFGMTTNGSTSKLVATGYNGGSGRYDYWVRFVGADGRKMAEIDPGIGGSGDNPDWPAQS
jgi:hypothetical protein